MSIFKNVNTELNRIYLEKHKNKQRQFNENQLITHLSKWYVLRTKKEKTQNRNNSETTNFVSFKLQTSYLFSFNRIFRILPASTNFKGII